MNNNELRDRRGEDTMNEALNLSTMAIADKVQRHVMASYYAIQLAALQKSVRKIGGAFVQRAHADYLPPDVEEHLALAVMLARERWLYPKETQVQHYQAAERRLEDGFSVVLLREILLALDALGLRLNVRQEGFDREALRAERLEWQAIKVEPPTSLTDYEIDVYVTQLLEFGENKK